MKTHTLRWLAPAPLWGRFGAGIEAALADDQHRPALLRFATDDFMEQLLGTLAKDPKQLGEFLASPETWRTPTLGGPDLIERTPVPRLAAALQRRRTAQAARSMLAPVVAEAVQDVQTQKRRLPLKLYQPAHQRHYLVGASLVCAQAGFPDRALVTGGVEQIGYIVRRLLPEAATVVNAPLREFAFIKDLAGPRWQRVSADDDAATLVDGEELLPLFPLAFADDERHPRRIWAGLVPVGRREEYMGTNVDRGSPGTSSLDAAAGGAPPPATISARKEQFKAEVTEPWKNLVRSAFTASDRVRETADPALGGDASQAQRLGQAFAHNMNAQSQSWLILLDLADYLKAHLADLWDVIDSGNGYADLSQRRKELYDGLGSLTVPSALQNALVDPATGVALKAIAPSLREALREVRADSVRVGLESVDIVYGPTTASDARWPPFQFVLAGLDDGFLPAGPFQQLGLLGTTGVDTADQDPVAAGAFISQQQAVDLLDSLVAQVARALIPDSETTAPPLSFAFKLRDALQANPGDAGWFVLRCVHRRRDCGPLHAPMVSAPTQRFQLASFFDSDAPARPIRVTLPLDTTPAGLRKFNKNTAFVISDVLCGQVQRAKGLGLVDLVRSVLPWPLHKDLDVGGMAPCKGSGGIDIGMICSLSIPIITICALLLLIIIVTLLDFIFGWLPYFILCLPVPGLKGKKGS